MDWSVVIPVVSANLVAVVVALIASRQNAAMLEETRRQHETSQEQERTLHDLDAVRTLLDEGALRLRSVSYAGIPLTPVSTAHSRELQEFVGATKELDELGARLEIRFGSEHEIVASYREAEAKAYELLWEAERISREVASQPSDDTLDQGDTAQKLWSAYEGFEGQRRAFVQAAQRWAGARLSEPKD